MAKGKFVIYKDVGGEFRWNLKAPNGEIIADSNEGYKAHKDCATGVNLVIKYSKTAAIEDTTGEASAKKAAKKKAAAKPAKKAAKKK
jgi:hypothetical protein